MGAHEFIEALPDGYDTDVNKRGGRVSAGQRQLLSFARAFLADPAVLILDEATASLDIPSERLGAGGPARPCSPTAPRSIIAHRLSTVAIADRVLVMEHGRIVEDGTPAELIGGTGTVRRSCTRRGGTRWSSRLRTEPAGRTAVAWRVDDETVDTSTTVDLVDVHGVLWCSAPAAPGGVNAGPRAQESRAWLGKADPAGRAPPGAPPFRLYPIVGPETVETVLTC